jgi:hypothetical protein
MIRNFLNTYTNRHFSVSWTRASLNTVQSFGAGSHTAKRLREWTYAFIMNRNALPHNPFGGWNVSLLEDDDLAMAIQLHLQGIGKYVKAMDIVTYLSSPDIQQRFGLTKTISLSTARRWMQTVGYHWSKTPKGQYVDGQEREDVIAYWQNVFLPAIAAVHNKLWPWTNLDETVTNCDEEMEGNPGPQPWNQQVILWFHDESIFYGHDRRKVRWVHEDEEPKPNQRGREHL